MVRLYFCIHLHLLPSIQCIEWPVFQHITRNSDQMYRNGIHIHVVLFQSPLCLFEGSCAFKNGLSASTQIQNLAQSVHVVNSQWLKYSAINDQSPENQCRDYGQTAQKSWSKF